MLPRVVVTGIGLLTPVGNDLASTWEALCQGKSGVGPITSYDSSRFRVHFGAEVKNFDPSLYMDRKEMRRTDPYEQFAIATAKQALAQSGLQITEEKGPNWAAVSACATSSNTIGEAWETIRRGDARAMITGGSEKGVTPIAMAAFDNMHAISRRNNDPQGASRPFDATRDGFVM